MARELGDGDEAVVAARDDGRGFPSELLHQAAGRFVGGPGVVEGAGLGLAIVDPSRRRTAGTSRSRIAAGNAAEVRLRLPLGSR
jgi:C4-dicarboxylate-specific signal transduction histidine kinase